MSTSQLLRNLIGSRALIVSSHSNNKVLCLQDNIWSEINVDNARGLSYNDNFVAVASSNCINFYNKNTGVFAGTINSYAYDIHEIEFVDNSEILACDSRASSLTRLSLGFKSITWTVPGVDLNTNDSRSLVNGVCVENNLPKYITVLGISNIADGWRDEANQSRSALINVQTNEIILHNLIFPHSPTLDEETVYFLNSGLNQVCKWSPGDNDFTVISTLNGWTRGLIVLDQYLLVGISQGRQSAVPNVISNQLDEPGIAIIDKVTGELVEFESLDVKEIFDLIISDKALS
jgi:uncharacterized protein (TIGR03032 family)